MAFESKTRILVKVKLRGAVILLACALKSTATQMPACTVERFSHLHAQVIEFLGVQPIGPDGAFHFRVRNSTERLEGQLIT